MVKHYLLVQSTRHGVFPKHFRLSRHCSYLTTSDEQNDLYALILYNNVETLCVPLYNSLRLYKEVCN